jgi:hypothetical protein
MLKLYQDKELKQKINSILLSFIKTMQIELLDTPEIFYSTDKKNECVNKILVELENRGYHVGLPPSIEEALNSGDGVYRP